MSSNEKRADGCKGFLEYNLICLKEKAAYNSLEYLQPIILAAILMQSLGKMALLCVRFYELEIESIVSDHACIKNNSIVASIHI